MSLVTHPNKTATIKAHINITIKYIIYIHKLTNSYDDHKPSHVLIIYDYYEH